MTRQRILICLAVAFFIDGARSAQGQRAPAILDPRDYTSPSGEYVSNVDPSDLYGRGEGSYRVTRNGMLLWSGKKPFTLWRAGITDDGLFAGYGYSHGVEGFFRESGREGPGEFHVIIMRATGEVLLNETTPRSQSRFLHRPPNPLAKGLLLDRAKDRLVIRVFDEDVNRRSDSWWAYELSTGTKLGKSSTGPDVIADEPRVDPSPMKTPEVPTRPLKHLGTFVLRDTSPVAQSPVRDISSFGIDDHGRFGFIRRDGTKSCSLVLVTTNGTVIRELNLPIDHKDKSAKTAWLEGDWWVIVSSDVGVGAKAAAWWFNSANGDLKEIKGLDCPAISEIAGSSSGGFVALGSKRLQYSFEDQLILFNKTGGVQWLMKEDHNGGAGALFSPKDATVTTSGQIAVVDVIRHTVQFFDSQRDFLRVVDLKSAWGRKPNYPSDIVADKDGGILVNDFRGNPPVVRMDAAGKVIGEFQPRHSDGRIIDAVLGFCVDRDGRVWACDGECFIRLRDDGVADMVLGTSPTTDNLGRIATLTVDQQGRLYAVDDRSGVVHIYDSAGSKLRVCKPEPADIKGKLSSAHLAVKDDGSLFFSDGDSSRFVQYAPDSRRLGFKELGLDDVREEWHPLPADRMLVLGYQNAFLVNGDGKVSRTIQRRSDRKWLGVTRGASVARDGSFAVLSGDGYWFKRFWHVNIYNENGDPIRMVTLPATFTDFCFAYTGMHLATRTVNEIVLFKATGEPLLKFAPEVAYFKDLESQRWSCFTTMDGRELWFVCAERKSISRFELPE